MPKNKILLACITAVVLVSLIYFLKVDSNESDQYVESVLNMADEPAVSDLPSLKNVKIGDKMGDFTVVSTELRDIGVHTAGTVNFVGGTTVKGTFFKDDMLGLVGFEVDDDHLSHIPRFKESSRALFTFNGDYMDIQSKYGTLADSAIPATITIKNFTKTIEYTHGFGGRTDLVSVIVE